MPIDCIIQTSEPELVLYICGRGNLLAKDLDHFRVFLDSHLHKGIPFKVFYDLRKVDGAPIHAIKKLTKYINDCEELARQFIVASSVLVGGKIVEKLVNMVFSIKKPSTPTKVTASLQEACDFLNSWDISEEPI